MQYKSRGIFQMISIFSGENDWKCGWQMEREDYDKYIFLLEQLYLMLFVTKHVLSDHYIQELFDDHLTCIFYLSRSSNSASFDCHLAEDIVDMSNFPENLGRLSQGFQGTNDHDS